MSTLLRRLMYLLRHRQQDNDLAEELQLHRTLKEAELGGVAGGTAATELQLRRALGNTIIAREDARSVWIPPWIDATMRDVRFGFRLLLRNPGFAAIAIATLAVTIGANTAVYTLVDRTLIRSLPYPDPKHLGTVARRYMLGGQRDDSYSQSGETYLALRNNSPAIDLGVVGEVTSVNLFADGRVTYVQQQRVSSGTFAVFGIAPMLGREFSAEEDRTGGPAVTVLSHGLWTRDFANDPDIVGREIRLRGEPFTVVGVMPPGFRSNVPADLWTPLRPFTGPGGGLNYLLIARVRPGATWGDAAGQVESAGATLVGDRIKPPAGVQLKIVLVPLQTLMTAELRAPLLVLWAAVGIVLLIGCVNIAGLMLVKGSARSQELAARIALGGGRAAIIRQLVVESLVLAACGGGAGVALGHLIAKGVATRLQDVVSLPVTPDFRVLAVALGASLLTSLIFGLLPALQASRTDVRTLLVQSGTSTITGPSRQWPARILVVAEISLGFVLVVAAGLMVRTFSHFTRLHPGFDATHVVTATLPLRDARYQTAASINDLFAKSLEAVRRTPAVESVAVALTLPFERALNIPWRFAGDGQPQSQPISLTYVTPEYFDALKIPLRRGRLFSERDTATSPPVLIVNESFVRRYLRDQEPIGRQLLSLMGKNPPAEIVGVIGDIQQRANFGPYEPLSALPAAYVPAAQYGDSGFRTAHTWFEPSVIVRTAAPLQDMPARMQDALRGIDSQLAFQKFRTMEEVQGEAMLMSRLQATLLGSLAAIAMLLCALGVYGMVAHSVTQRQREFGLRMALGARPSAIMKNATMPVMALSLCGVAAGLAAAAGGAKIMQRLVFGVSVHDRLTFVIAAFVVTLTALVAAFIPAFRAIRGNPVIAMRSH